MRRQAPTMAISPQQLKHFAAATVAITALLALFAGGEQASVAAQVRATQAKNDLNAAGQKNLGTKRIANKLALRPTMGGGFGEEAGGDFGSGGGGGGGARPARSGMPMPKAQGPKFLPPMNLEAKPDGRVQKKRMLKPGSSEHPGAPAGQTANDDSDSGDGGAGRGPDTSKLGSIIEASRARSGSGSSNGD
jgi:hypothetical protein